MADINTGATLGVTENITNTVLNTLADNGTVTNIVNADISASADIAGSKLLDSSVTKAKIENVADMKVLGNTSGSATAPQEVDVLDEDNMTSDSATALATQQSIKAYIDGLISIGPKFVSLTGGTIALTQEAFVTGASTATKTWNIADFTSDDVDFATDKIIGLIVEVGIAHGGGGAGFCHATATLPDGTTTFLVATQEPGDVPVTTTTVPVNNNTSSVDIFVSMIGAVGYDNGTINRQRVRIRGAIIQPTL